MGSSFPLCCISVSLFDFTNSCTRALWISFPPAALVTLICIFSIRLPLPGRLNKVVDAIRSPFKTYLTLDEAEALIGDDNYKQNAKDEQEKPAASPLWKTLVLYNLTIVFLFYLNSRSPSSYPLTLFYPLSTVFKPTPTAPVDLFTVYASLFIGDLVHLGDVLYDRQIYNVQIPSLVVAELVFQLSSILLVLGVVLSMPLAVPSARVTKDEIGKSVSLEDYSSLWAWITFSWVKVLVDRGRSATLNDGDVWNLSPTLQSKPVFTKFTATNGPTLLRRLWAANSQYVIIDFSVKYISVMFSYAAPFFLKRILDSIDLANPTPQSRMNAYIYAFLAFACSLCKTQADARHLYAGRRLVTRVRTELMAAIYDKALKRRDYSGIVDKEEAKAKKGEDKAKADDPKAGADIGKIVNLMAATRTGMVSGAYHMYGAPLEVIIAGIYLYQLLGLSAFAGFIVLIIGVRIHKGVLAARDKRMGVLNELISAVCLAVLPQRSMTNIILARVNQVLFHLLWSSAPILVSIVSFFTYVMLGNELTVSTAFTAIILFGMIRAPLGVIPSWFVQLLQTGVALKRISVYLGEDEVDSQVCSLKKDLSEPELPSEEKGLGLVNAMLKWNEVPVEKDDKKDMKKDKKGKKAASASPVNEGDESVATTITAIEDVDLLGTGSGERRFELKDVDIMFPEGKLTVVTGPTASGKTALLMALLGEMTLTQGKLVMSKNISSVDENGYMQAISYSSQSPWLRHQSIKDNILFGYPYDEERYNDVVEACALRPDLEVLEDGDATEIGARGVNLSGGQKARVALARAVYARTKYVLLDDPLSAVDSHTARFLYEKLLLGPLLAGRTVILVTHHVELVLPGAYYLVRMLDGRIDTQGTTAELRLRGVLDDISHDVDADTAEKGKEVEREVAAVEETGNPLVRSKNPRKLVRDEHREEGRVKWIIYKSYLKASSYWIWCFLLFLVFVNQLVGVSEKFWIKTWGDAANDHPLFYVSIYAAIGIGGVLVNVSSVTAQYTGALRASKKLFRQLLITVVHATFRFHDTTPQGRMMNRFGKDIETIDTSLAGSLQSVNSSLAGFFASILTVAVVFPYFLIPAFFIGLAYRELAIGYLNTGRDLRRMESNTRSPIYSDFGELLEGIVTVRAFSAERPVLITTVFSIGTLSNSAGLAGVCITSAMAFTQAVYWACHLNSVERVFRLPQEPPAIIESNLSPDLPAVIQDVSFTLKAGERVGLIGRTGSGKSTLAMSILRFVDPAVAYVIDGIDISTIGVHDLRSKLDATLFSGTLRDNLDPFGEHEVSECLDVLYRVHLINPSTNAIERESHDLASEPFSGADHESTVDTISTTVTEVEGKTTIGLDSQVSAGGTNFSQGQRQLIAMARALLRRSSIIVLDEATSSIDFSTDAKIQTAIREEFKESLLLTVAHRLHTIIDYDRLIVLDRGQIAEFDTPWNLLQKEDGIFRTMCLKSGQYSELEEAAKKMTEKN
ncbi:hypothetical protein BDQ17DRAFT_1391964 [Cyathus striatus]|nr:hypothetical protein BDQ17DRAFT_1391964 [Cyathus striatus]